MAAERGRGPGGGPPVGAEPAPERPVSPTPGTHPRPWPPRAAAAARQIARDGARLRVRLGALLAALGGRRAGVYDGRVRAAERRLKAGIGRSPDVCIRPFRVGGEEGLDALLVFVSGLVDARMVDQDTLTLAHLAPPDRLGPPGRERAPAVASHLGVGHVTYARRWRTILAKVLAGNAVLLVEGADRAIVLDTTQYPARSVSEPDVEHSVLGSHEGFNEVLLTHMNQIRRYVQSPQLVFESVEFGTVSRTSGIIVYLDGVCNPAVLTAVRRRLAGLRDSSVITVNRLVSTLKDHAWTPFPLVRTTPRVDFVAHEVMAGRVAIMLENSPFALLVPATFLDFYRTSEDYEGQFWGPTLDRLVRLVGLVFAVYSPALYIALVDVNPDFLPTRLLWTVAGSRENLPFPPQVEVLLMFGVLEILREASLRMPSSMTTALGTAGAVIIGTAVVKAGVVSSLIIVVVSLGALALFTSPTWEVTIAMRWLLWPLVLGAYAFGVIGVLLVTVIILQHMASLSSLGVPYLAPFGPFRPRDWKDSVVRLPLRDLTTRPSSLFTLRPRTQPPIGRPVTEPDVPLAAARRRRT
jgi:spore germination protein KA